MGIVTFIKNDGNVGERKISVTSTHSSLLNLNSNDLYYYHRIFNDIVDDCGNIIEVDEHGTPMKCPYYIITFLNAYLKTDGDIARVHFKDNTHTKTYIFRLGLHRIGI